MQYLAVVFIFHFMVKLSQTYEQSLDWHFRNDPLIQQILTVLPSFKVISRTTELLVVKFLHFWFEVISWLTSYCEILIQF